MSCRWIRCISARCGVREGIPHLGDDPDRSIYLQFDGSIDLQLDHAPSQQTLMHPPGDADVETNSLSAGSIAPTPPVPPAPGPGPAVPAGGKGDAAVEAPAEDAAPVHLLGDEGRREVRGKGGSLRSTWGRPAGQSYGFTWGSAWRRWRSAQHMGRCSSRGRPGQVAVWCVHRQAPRNRKCAAKVAVCAAYGEVERGQGEWQSTLYSTQ